LSDSSIYDNEVISYHIDVITEAYLPSFLALVEKEMASVRQLIQRQKNDVIQSTHKIVLEVNKLEKKPTNYRKQLGYDF
jgi:hypothetical protein